MRFPIQSRFEQIPLNMNLLFKLELGFVVTLVVIILFGWIIFPAVIKSQIKSVSPLCIFDTLSEKKRKENNNNNKIEHYFKVND